MNDNEKKSEVVDLRWCVEHGCTADEHKPDCPRAVSERQAGDVLMQPDPLDAGMKHGHGHRWCSQECLDNDCEFGPCCIVAREVRTFDLNNCPNCDAVWRLSEGAGTQLIGVVINDRVDHWRCPNCDLTWTRNATFPKQDVTLVPDLGPGGESAAVASATGLLGGSDVSTPQEPAS